MTKEIDDLLGQVELAIANSDRPRASELMARALELAPGSLSAHNLRERYRLPGNFSDWMGVDGRISPDDDIYRFFANHPTSVNPVRDYLSDGWRTAVELQQVLDLCGLSLGRCQHFLEFASGHGRFTRHLVQLLPQGALTVSDVVPGSVDFLQNTFGVRGFYSSTAPEQLVIAEKYDVIFVLSLFSHLPSSVWIAWLKLLHGALKPGGVLIFSTHGEKCAHLQGVDLSDHDYRFFPSSESTALDGETYGCAYAGEAYVRDIIVEAVGPDVKVQTRVNHFWGNQDAIMVFA